MHFTHHAIWWRRTPLVCASFALLGILGSPLAARCQVVANDDAYETSQDVQLTVAAPGVLANDFDDDPGPEVLEAYLDSSPAHGTLSLNYDGSFTYTPDPGYSGPDSFTYDAIDWWWGDDNYATVNLTVTPNPVTANDDAYTAELNGAVIQGAATGVLANDTDSNGDPLSAVLLTGPAHGTLTFNLDGSFNYQAMAGFYGQDSFTYEATDGNGDNSSPANVTLTVPANPPVATNDAYSAMQNTPLTVTAPGVLANDTDPFGLPLSAVLVSAPSHGTVTLNADGSFTYVPLAGYFGTDSFSYEATDGSQSSSPATVSLTVVPPPVAVNDAYSDVQGVPLTVSAPSGVLANDFDLSGNPLTAVLVIAPPHGTLTLNADGSFSYVPSAGFYGTDSFAYEASDGSQLSNLATVTIYVAAAPPVANSDAYTTEQGLPLTVSTPGVLVNDTDPSGNPLSAVLVSGPAHGSLTMNSDGSFTYSPDPSYAGPDSFTYQATDGSQVSAPAIVTFLVTPDTNAPITLDSLSGPQGTHGWYTGDVQVSLIPSDDASGVALTVYTIDGGMPQLYIVPFTVSGDGIHDITFHSIDVAGNVEEDEDDTVRIDGTAPTLTFGPTAPAPNAAGWSNSPVSVPYTAADATSGIYVHAPNNRRPERPIGVPTLDGSVPFNAEGIGQTQTVTITDVAGNHRDFTTPSINIDLTKPVTVAATQSGSAGQMVTLTATDNLSGVASTVYSIDGGYGQSYTVPFTVSGNGDHVVTFHSVDAAGNVEDAEQISFTVNIDAPITTASLSGTQGDNGWYTGDVTVSLAAQAAGVAIGGTFYTIDGGSQQSYTGPFTVSGDAVHTVIYWSADAAGNAEAQNQLPVKIDGTAPTLTVGAPSPAPNAAGWNNSPVTFTVSGTDALSGFAGIDPAGPVTFSGAGKGQTQTVTGKDNAGNAASVSTPVVNIDLAAPTTTASPSGSVGSDGSYTSAATVTLSASDDLSGVAGTTYAIDGGTAQPYTKPFTVSGTGTHTVTFSSTDVAGNAEASKTLSVTVAAPAIPVLHTFPAGLQMIAVPESYGAASSALSPAPSKLAVWSPSLVQYTLSDGSAALAPGQGYWVRLGQSADLLDAGTPTPTSQPFAVSLQKGWNMIGDPFPSAVSLSGVTVSSSAGKSFSLKDANLAGLISVTLYSYPAGSSAYQTTGEDGSLSPYTGYWVYAFQPCSLSLPVPTTP
jgi:hypothetical protein